MQTHTVRRMLTAATAAALFTLLLAVGCSSPPPPPPQETAATQPPTSPFEKLLVRRPGNEPEDGKVYLVRNGKKQWVVNAKWLAANGYRFPEDVREISAAELAAIPTGDPIE
ncbi:MAG: hypothetical protein ABI972_03345 [Acidobacteriota bacterium]